MQTSDYQLDKRLLLLIRHVQGFNLGKQLCRKATVINHPFQDGVVVADVLLDPLILNLILHHSIYYLIVVLLVLLVALDIPT